MIKKSKYISLSLFFIFLLLGVFTVKEQSNLLNISFRLISLLSLISYYVLTVKNRNPYFVLALITFLISDVFFSINSSHLLGGIALILSRGFLILVISPDCKKGDKKLLLSIIVLMLLLCAVLLQFYYQDTMFFYISIFVCLALTVLIALTFSILLQSQKKNEYSAMFLGLFLLLFLIPFLEYKKFPRGKLILCYLILLQYFYIS